MLGGFYGGRELMAMEVEWAARTLGAGRIDSRVPSFILPSFIYWGPDTNTVEDYYSIIKLES